MTKYEKCIYDVVNKTFSHMTAEQIYHEVKKDFPHVVLATVYNNLNKLCRDGLIRRISIDRIVKHACPLQHRFRHKP